MGRYGRGVWAGAIRHHQGAFWVVFGTPDEGYFISRAPAATGPWSPPHALLAEAGWDDCCPLWDDDGRAYLVGTHFADGYSTWIFPMRPDGSAIDRDRAVRVNQGQGREANKLLKIGGRYYLIFSADIDGVGRCVMARRAAAAMGPYSPARQLAQDSAAALEPNQGGLVQTPGGAWYFFTHHGHGDWEGRAASLLPVTWRGGWPIIGAVQPDGLGAMVWSGVKPGPGARTDYSFHDDFKTAVLDPRWRWNHQPRDDHWSLTERLGRLRLRAWPPLKPGAVMTAGNTLSQPSFRTPDNRFTVALA
jgi:beta-xylosidase